MGKKNNFKNFKNFITDSLEKRQNNSLSIVKVLKIHE